jgi:hypothetical protein
LEGRCLCDGEVDREDDELRWKRFCRRSASVARSLACVARPLEESTSHDQQSFPEHFDSFICVNPPSFVLTSFFSYQTPSHG